MPVDHFFDAAILIAIGFTLIIQSKLGHHMASQQQAVDAVVEQLVKSREEILGAQRDLFSKIADVQAQLDAADVATVDLSALSAAAQALDDIVPDAVVEAPVVDEVVVDEPVVDEPPVS
jgi:hypothetical protein